MRPEDWKSVTPGMGSCFHQSLHRWALLHRNMEYGWSIALGIVGANMYDPVRHLHAWLERDAVVMSAVTGESFERFDFYRQVGIEPNSVRRVNPRKLLRRAKWTISGDTVDALLKASGIPFKVSDQGGVLPKGDQ